MTKKSTLLLNLAVLSTLGLAAGCNETPRSKVGKVSGAEASKLVDEGKTVEAAEMYTRIGEILLSKPEGIPHAEEMFEKALELNPDNGKANLYSAMIAPSLTTKGLVTRFKKMRSEKSQKYAVELEERIRDMGVQEFVDFALVMPKGATEATSLEDFRKFVRDEYAKELDKSIKKLEKIKETKLAVSMDISKYKEKREPLVYCYQDDSGDYACNVEKAESYEKKMNVDSYDIKALSIILKTQRNALTMAYSLKLQGFEEVAKKVSKMSSKTDRDIVATIKTQPELLKLDGSREDLQVLFSSTESTMNDLLDFSRISKELCGSEERKENVVSEICVTEAAADKINELLMFVVGPKEVLLGYDAQGAEVSVEVNARALLDAKVSSIQDLLPTKFNSAGKAQSVKDLSLMGVIPNSDLIEKLKTVVK